MSLDPDSNYYDAGGIETIEIIRAKLTQDQFQGWLLGNVIKYSTRLNHKGTYARDAEKLSTYSSLLNDELQEVNADAHEPEMECVDESEFWRRDDLRGRGAMIHLCPGERNKVLLFGKARYSKDKYWWHRCTHPFNQYKDLGVLRGHDCEWCGAKFIHYVLRPLAKAFDIPYEDLVRHVEQSSYTS